MLNQIPSPSDLHRVAATDHETAAQRHRETAELHDQYKYAEANVSALKTLECCMQSYNQSLIACQSSNLPHQQSDSLQ